MEIEILCPCCQEPIAVSIKHRPAPTALSRPSHDPIEPQQRRPDGTLMTMARASSFKLGFGKHKDLTLAEVNAKDRGWLKWYAEEGKEGSTKRAVVFFLDHLDSQSA